MTADRPKDFIREIIDADLAAGLGRTPRIHPHIRIDASIARACSSCTRLASSPPRGFCPSCLGRRMADTAVHLEQSVLPRVPIRHWICSLPWGLRALLGYDRKLCAKVVSGFMAEVDRSLRWRAKRELGLASVADAHTAST